MLCNSKLQISLHKRVQHWENQNQFLQARHGHKKDSTPEIILVGLRRDDDGFELLLWAISVAARPGDTVIAFHMNHIGAKAENSTNKLQPKDCQEHEATLTQSNVLKDLCEIKHVQLDAKFVTCGNEELQLIEEASSLLATMLVIRPSSRHELRNIQKTGSLLVQKVHTGCSVVIVKDYKMIFYKENVLKEVKDSSSMSSEDSNHGTPILRSKSLNVPVFSLQRQSSCKSSPLWEHDKEGTYDLDTNILTGNKVWPVHMGGEGSPRGVLDGLGLSSDTDTSSSSSSGSSLQHSLSRKGLLSCVLSQGDNDEVVSHNRSRSILNLRRNGSMKRFSTFPTTGCPMKLPGPVDCTSMKSSFKTYINTLRSTESMSHDPLTPTPVMESNWRCFSYEELAIATNYFNPDHMVGRGGHSEVYKGILLDGRLVAIKKLTNGSSEATKEKDFLTELGIIGHVSHPNTLPLVGFCVEEGLHLIFNFSSHGSLATLLHDVNAPLLDWSIRYRVAVGTARGLHYLHTGCPRRIIHRDIKASNILLGPEFEPQISDFGLAKWLPEQWSQLNVFPVEGTFGYLAPEYFMHGVIHEKTDVFAFGVLLLELITGKQPINKSQQSLVIWAKPLLESMRIEDLVDPRLAGAFEHGEMQTMVKAAALCVHSSATCRPYMGQVLEMLTGESCELHSIPVSLSDRYQDSSEEYSSSNYLSDLSRHREIALQF
eukprot:c22135_g1_i1 orf=123-2258(+)